MFIFYMPKLGKISKKFMFYKLLEDTMLITTQIKLKYLLYPK